MKNFVQEGNALDFIAGVGGVIAGRLYISGGIVHVASTSVAEGESYSGWTEGVYEFAAATHANAQALGVGDAVYWDAANARCTKTAAGFPLVGACTEAKASLAATVKVKLWSRAAAQGAAIADLAGGADLATTVAKVNAVLAALRAAGVITA